MRGLHNFTWRTLAATFICTQTLTALGNGLINGTAHSVSQFFGSECSVPSVKNVSPKIPFKW